MVRAETYDRQRRCLLPSVELHADGRLRTPHPDASHAGTGQAVTYLSFDVRSPTELGNKPFFCINIVLSRVRYEPRVPAKIH